MQAKVANLADGPLRYLESGSGKTIVFLHAFPLSADQWLPQLHRLPPGWRALAPDLRGFRGATAAFARRVGEMTMDDYAADVLALLTHLDVDRAVIAGLSMGGYIAFALVRQAAPRVRGLVLANTRATPDSQEGLAGRDRTIALAERDGPGGVAIDMVPKLLGETTRRDQPDLAEMVRRMIEVNPIEAIVAATRAMKMRPDSTPLLATIACPTLIVSGEEDRLMPHADVAAMQAAIAGAELAEIRHAGHLTNLEAPSAFNTALARFLERCS